jgi:hypothetical protein
LRPLCIQGLWIGDALSPLERLCIQSFLAHGHEFQLYTYGNVAGVPAGVVIRDAASIVPPSQIFKYRGFDSYAGFSCLFRYKALLERGGCWIDLDVVCLSPLAVDSYLFMGERVPNMPNAIQAGNALIVVPPGSAVMELCYDAAKSADPAQLKWGQIGPKLLTRCIDQLGLHRYIVPPDVYCPIDWWNWKQYVDGSLRLESLQGAMGLHLWNEMWRREGVDKAQAFPANCVYEELKRRYLQSG